MSLNTPEEIVAYTEEEGAEFVDVRSTDAPGTEQHFIISASAFDEDAMTEGLAFDGSSARGPTSIDESDIVLLPDLSIARIDPFRRAKTLNVKFFVHDSFTLEPFSRDPRDVAKEAEEYLISIDIADTCFFGAEAKPYIFDNVKFETDINRGFYEVDSAEGWWNRGEDENPDGSANLGYKIHLKGGCFPIVPYDHHQDLRDKIYLQLANVGLELERAHHEVGTGDQQEVNYKFNTMLRVVDDLQSFKYIIRNTAWEEGKSVTFMPKPLSGDNDSGMHAHQSLWKDGKLLFHDEAGYAGLSDIACWYIGGILYRAGVVLAFTNPTLNSYHRLVKGFEAPINLVYLQRNRFAAVRILITGSNSRVKCIEFRAPDPSGNLHLGFTAMMMAGLDGVKNRIESHASVDKDLYEFPPEKVADIPQALTSLKAVSEALRNDYRFLLEGDVFTEDFIQTYIDYKYKNETELVRLRPTPQEFEMYYDRQSFRSTTAIANSIQCFSWPSNGLVGCRPTTVNVARWFFIAAMLTAGAWARVCARM